MNKIKGYVAIEKKHEEDEKKYKTKIVEMTYALLEAYDALPREIDKKEKPFDNGERISMLQEQPGDYGALWKRWLSYKEHHEEHGWNKKLPEDSIDDIFVFGHEELEENRYINDDDAIHWVRVINGDERREIDAYLLKFADYAHIDDKGVSIFNGVMFYADYSRDMHDKIKRVIKTFADVLEQKGIAYNTRIERTICGETLIEYLRKTEKGAEWVVQGR